jgi:hypothetical protein
LSRKRLKEKLHRAQQDILFLLEVERLHCDRNKELRQASFKTRVRNEAFGHGFSWSGSFTAGRVRAAEIRQASALKTTVAAHVIVLCKHGIVTGAAGVRWLVAKTVTGSRAAVRHARSRAGHANSTT